MNSNSKSAQILLCAGAEKTGVPWWRNWWFDGIRNQESRTFDELGSHRHSKSSIQSIQSIQWMCFLITLHVDSSFDHVWSGLRIWIRDIFRAFLSSLRMSSASSLEAFHSAPVGSQVWELTGEVTDLTDFSDPVQVKSKSRRTSKNVVRSPGVILWCSHFSCRNAEKPSRKCDAVLEISSSRIWKHLETCENQSLWSPPSLQVRAAEERRRKAKRCRSEICLGGIELVGGLEHWEQSSHLTTLW